jgi:hypothetical protein
VVLSELAHSGYGRQSEGLARIFRSRDALFKPVITVHYIFQFQRVSGCIAAALVLSACAPTAPRFGNFGGPVVAPSAQAQPASDDICAVAQPASICWTPVQARFHPNGDQMVVNLCSNRLGAIYYCRMVEYRWADQRWRLLPGQEEGKSYQYPSYSADGKTLVFGVATCEQPDCKENSGYGQLATMAVQATSGDDTVYGPLKLLPVAGISRPNFSPDGQQILYWRSHHQSRLASGRNIGSISVFGYKPATDEEANLVPGLHTDSAKVHFITALTGPRYSLDGSVIRFTALDDGFWAKDLRAVGVGIVDVDYNVKTARPVARDIQRVAKGLGQVYAEHPTQGILAGAGNLRLVDPKPPHATRVAFFSPESYQVGDADIDKAGAWAAGLSGIQSMMSGRQGVEFDHWLWADEHRGAAKRERTAPVFTLVHIQSREVRAVQWPNVESLNH